mmetsp:Transcript_3757/g.9589  ORF Transcript_3757/g.9589 Transcript_3757/m.9589 type:complete len:81 (+) Transcript_3757:67-309(+)
MCNLRGLSPPISCGEEYILNSRHGSLSPNHSVFMKNLTCIQVDAKTKQYLKKQIITTNRTKHPPKKTTNKNQKPRSLSEC